MTITANERLITGVFDAGYVQRREWMLYKIRPDHYPFNVPYNLTVASFDRELVQKVLDRIVERHEILRTTLKAVDGRLKQVVHSPESYPVHLSFFDIKDRPAKDKAEYVRGKITLLSHTPFNFEFGPLFRVAVFGLSPSEYLVHFVFHHLISDAQSINIFRNELGEIFRIISRNAANALPGITQYREQTCFENQLLDSSQGDPYRKYWSEVLSHGSPPLLLIHKDKREEYNMYFQLKCREVMEKISQLDAYDKRCIPSVIRRYRVEEAGQLRFIYTGDVFEKISRYRERGRNSLLSIFIAAILLAFYRSSGQTAFVFEVPASGRANKDFRQTMGWLTTGGPCYFDISGERSALSLLDYIDHQLYQLSKYCVYPPDAVGYNMDPPQGSRMPVFLTLTHTEDDPLPQKTGIVSHQTEDAGTYQDIAFFFVAGSRSIELSVIYNNMLFAPTQVEALVTEQLISMEELLTMALPD